MWGTGALVHTMTGRLKTGVGKAGGEGVSQQDFTVGLAGGHMFSHRKSLKYGSGPPTLQELSVLLWRD